jgi:hypothetical protein
MRVSIDHRQRTTGLGGAQSQFVMCTVQFSEEEKAIIAVRGLLDHIIILDPPTPPPSRRVYMTAGILRAFSPLAGVIGFWTLVPSVVATLFSGGRSGGEFVLLGGLLFFGSPIAWAIGFLMDRSIDFRFANPKQHVSIREMLHRPFTVYSPDPAYSDLVVEQIKERLAILKAVISGSAEMRQKQTYEL